MLDDNEAAAFRNQHIGFVFQDHALLPQCTVLENVLVPTLVAPEGPYKHQGARDCSIASVFRTGSTISLRSFREAKNNAPRSPER